MQLIHIILLGVLHSVNFVQGKNGRQRANVRKTENDLLLEQVMGEIGNNPKDELVRMILFKELRKSRDTEKRVKKMKAGLERELDREESEELWKSGRGVHYIALFLLVIIVLVVLVIVRDLDTKHPLVRKQHARARGNQRGTAPRDKKDT
mmetsp:Transcript_86856/g.173754  ORF Transcript_86856/g.173754 Transcript_86856/m.173754 type:complete len:150 (-) Transcript_86856:36-485(-)